MMMQEAEKVHKQAKVRPPKMWMAAMLVLEHWLVFLSILFGDASRHPGVQAMQDLIQQCATLCTTMDEECQVDPHILAALVHLVQVEFNESFCQAEAGMGQVIWSIFVCTICHLATGCFLPDLVGLLVVLQNVMAPPPEDDNMCPPRNPMPRAPRLSDNNISVNNLSLVAEWQLGANFKLKPVITYVAMQDGGDVPKMDD